MDRTIGGERLYSFRQDFADAWYELNNPDLSATPMKVTFESLAADFPSNCEQPDIDHVTLYLKRRAGSSFEVDVANLVLDGVGGKASKSQDGVISTRRGNAGAWSQISQGF